MRHSKLALFGIAVIAATSTSTTQAVAAPAPQVIDLNRASLEELLAFDGIGRLYAAKIVAARPFKRRSELVHRHVIPVPVYLALKSRLYVTESPEAASADVGTVPDGMVDLNRASFDELLAVPGIGRAYAGRVVAGRPYRTELELVARRIMPLSVFTSIEGRVAVPR